MTAKDNTNPRTMPTKALIDAYRETGSYRQAAKKLGVSVQFLHQRIKKYPNDITTKEFINYHAMTREQIESYIDQQVSKRLLEIIGEDEVVGSWRDLMPQYKTEQWSKEQIEKRIRNELRHELRQSIEGKHE